MNRYKVDRANTLQAPVGMTAMLYVGDDLATARKVFDNAQPGLSPWGELHKSYGILLTEWKETSYQVLMSKGIQP